jgi:hypothetical protein
VISSKAPNCNRRWCLAVYLKWSRDQRRVTAEALRENGGLLLLTDVTLPGTPEQEQHRANVAIPWGADRRGEAKALYKAKCRFKLRMRWLKRKAYNDARSVLRKAGCESDRLPPVLVGNLEVQKRGALHTHLALPYTTPFETFTRAFIDAMKYWAPLCGLGYVQGWKAAERSKVLGHEKAIGCRHMAIQARAAVRARASSLIAAWRPACQPLIRGVQRGDSSRLLPLGAEQLTANVSSLGASDLK